MKSEVLVAYASKYGATAEIAEKIGEVLREEGFQAEVLPVKRVGDLSRFKAVVLGSAVYMGFFRREAATFLKAREKELAQLPVWLFSSGPVDKGDPMVLSEGWLFPEALRPAIDSIKPKDITCFSGKVDDKDIGFFERFIMKKVNATAGDYRDWTAIASWAETIAGSLTNQ